MDLTERVAGELDAARRRSLDLLDALDDDVLARQHSPIMSPLVWDLAHVGNYEELWLLRALGYPPVRPDLDDVYDAFRHPRPERPSLPLLSAPAAKQYLTSVRDRVLDVLDRDAPAADDPAPWRAADPRSRPRPSLAAGGFVYGMVIQHEHQHDETMLATLQLAGGTGQAPGAEPVPVGRSLPADEVLVDGGPFTMGTDTLPWAYDNERPAHTLDLPAFWIDTAPVSNGRYRAFVEAGGYSEPAHWSPEGWAWRRESGAQHPEGWHPEGEGSWSCDRFGGRITLEPNEPVQHVCWYEADAYARWCGRRLPTEAEWEKAASTDRAGVKRTFPWGDSEPAAGRANLGQRHLGPAPIGSYPSGSSPWGCEQMIGDVWEWTSSDFSPYPGFISFPYREYSEVFYGSGYKVLRGGSWATDPTAVRATFRNWDLPVRRQIFSGFRCARTAEEGARA